ncbi:hypothetical protein BM607_003440 [Shewanella sp. SACH]|nr:hypothetical protein BM607_003440 [Shewanella sp. SACH]
MAMKKNTVIPLRLMLRLPPEVHQIAKEMSEQQLRSLNSEIVYQLKRAYGLVEKEEVAA